MNPDFLYPTGQGKNRDEYFLVEYDDIMQSSAEMCILATLLLPEDRVNFPIIDDMDVINPKELFEQCALVDELSLMMELRGDKDKLSQEYVEDVIRRAHKIDTWNQRSKTMIEYAIINLATQDFVKRIDFVNRRGFEPFEIAHLTGLFGKDIEKINFYQGNVAPLMKDHEECTTVFLNDPDEALMILKDPDAYHLFQSVLILRSSLRTHSIEYPNGDSHYILKDHYSDQFKKLCDLKPWKLGSFIPSLFIPPTQGEGAI